MEITGRSSPPDKNDGFQILGILADLGISDYTWIGDPEIIFRSPGRIWDASPGNISFCSSKKVSDIIRTINDSKASVVLTELLDDPIQLNIEEKIIIMYSNPRDLFVKILGRCFSEERGQGLIHESAVIHDEAIIHPMVSIGPFCVIGNCVIGEGTVIHSHAIINDRVRIGKNVTIFPQCVIGYDGFGFNRNESSFPYRGTGDESLERFVSFGGVDIGDEVEIFPLTNIDRGTMSDTKIGRGTKIDHLCHIGHNVVLGRHCIIAACTVIAGSATVADNTWIGPNSTIKNGVAVGSGSLIGLATNVTKNIDEQSIVMGNPVMTQDRFRASRRVMNRLIAKQEEM